ncbi:uncharacterized protein LOC62_04G006061 [Vanrija pseudolonga]|uniref:Uncharacterized protein n=1 Tax=Vanrija pseudolonga TaxID=143232 RepID=A0AAF0YCZ1_9TREE|nr:hypothetical protein LOC62_04G006061 [Vanrija pseudolonga]
MTTNLGQYPIFSPHRNGYRLGHDNLPVRSLQFLAYKWGPYSTWLAGMAIGDESYFDPRQRMFMWRIATCVSGARITRADGDVVAIPRGVFERMARVEKDVYMPAYKFKLEALAERRRSICGYAAWATPPPTEEMRQVAHAFANMRVRQVEGLSSHGPEHVGRAAALAPSSGTHDDCDASFVAEAERLQADRAIAEEAEEEEEE